MTTAVKLFTDEQKNVTDFIKDGRTDFVATKAEAIERTKKVGYFYPLYNADKQHVGYGIPK